jgi:5-methylcytosine-specific restriction endonuclease McrA
MEIISLSEAKAAGLKRYFTGSKCTNGHIADRFVSSRGCTVCQAERFAKYSANNRSYETQRQRKWVEANKEYRAITMRKYVKAYKERNRDRLRLAARAFQSKRRAWKRSSKGTFTSEDVVKLHALQSGKCACCKINLKKYHIDHINPLSAGGSNDFYNLQLLCPHCNLSKGAKDPIAFMQERGYLF